MSPAKLVYSREEARRAFKITERQLRSWERQQLLPGSAEFGFKDLVALRTLVELRNERVSPAKIKKAVRALRAGMRGVGNPLTELRIYADGSEIRVDIDGGTIEPITGQLLLKFAPDDMKRLLSFPHAGEGQEPVQAHKRRLEAEMLFEQALQMEQHSAPVTDVVAVYERAIELDPQSTGAFVNLGTIYFNARQFAAAEKYYRMALEADPEYPLAHFNLGNLYDERGDRARALQHYLAALQINPAYADAHYNLALLYQNSNQPMKAARHWREYLKCDPSSSWAAIARRELDRIRTATIVHGGGQ